MTTKTLLPLTLESNQSGLLNDRLPPSSQIPPDEPESEELLALYDDFNLEGIDKEDLIHWSQAAPKGQRLEDAKSHEKRASPKRSSSTSNSSMPKAV